MKLNTKCVQAGYRPKNGEERVVPISQSTTFLYETPEEMGDLFDLKKEGFFYTRLGNPTNDALEKKVASLEDGIGALATSSGMSATFLTALTLCHAGDNFLTASEIYGGTYNLFAHSLKKLGIEGRFFSSDAKKEEIESLVDDKTKFIFIETIANPACVVADFDKFAEIGKKYGIVVVCDNTLASPVICQPKKYGVDIIVHSSTKYLDGHATSVGGVIVETGTFNFKGNSRYQDFNVPDVTYHGLVFADVPAPFITRARTVAMRDFGAQMSPMNAFLTNLGTETLSLRMERTSENALAVAEFLENHPLIEWVKYPGLKSSKYNGLVNKYFEKGMSSGMMSVGIKGGLEACLKFQKALKVFAIVTHVADVRSCVLHPATTTHRQLSEKDLLDCGIAPNMVRISVGIEDKDDLIEDLRNALEKATK